LFASVLVLGVPVLGAALTSGAASAQQQQPAATPPVAVSPGWRYEKVPAEGADIHRFVCERPQCGPQSVVSYRIYSPSAAMRLEEYRQREDTVLAMMRERAAPGTKITVLDLKGDDTGKLPSFFEVRRLTEFPNGRKEYRVSSVLQSNKYSATLISSSDEEQAATANHANFTLPLMLFITKPPS
jgi:hypothetical protein